MAEVSLQNTAVGTPAWWLKRLLDKLRQRAVDARMFDEFHEGKQGLAFASEKFREVFAARYRNLPSNLMPLVVNAEKDRLIVQGFRFANRPQGDPATWRIWQDNQLDAESLIAHEIALVKGQAFTLVAPSSDGPVITIEDPTEVIVESAPGNRRLRQAALKVYRDDAGYMRAYLYLPGGIYRYISRAPVQGDTTATWESMSWSEYVDDDGVFPLANPLGVVPVIPLTNRPRRDGSGRSEIEAVMGNQNAINKLRFDALVASEFVAFPQRWATNIDIPEDPDTGKPISPFRPGVDMIWTQRRLAPDEAAEYGDKAPQPAFGQFPSGDLSGYFKAIENELSLMVAGSATPYYYLFGAPSSVPPTGESIKSSEAPLVKKVIAQERHFGEGWEETMRLALVADGQKAKARTDGEVIWGDEETRNEAVRTDSVLKQYVAGLLPVEFALEELGYSQQAISRILALRVPAVLPASAPGGLGGTSGG